MYDVQCHANWRVAGPGSVEVVPYPDGPCDGDDLSIDLAAVADGQAVYAATYRKSTAAEVFAVDTVTVIGGPAPFSSVCDTGSSKVTVPIDGKVPVTLDFGKCAVEDDHAADEGDDEDDDHPDVLIGAESHTHSEHASHCASTCPPVVRVVY
jgi:hypothetical protein